MVQCKTKGATLAADLISIKIDASVTPCTGTADVCTYQTTSTIPSVYSISKIDDYNVKMTGVLMTSFPDHDPVLVFANITADTVSIVNATYATATFTNGVPLTTAALKPVLYFNHPQTNATHWSSVVAAATLNNLVSATAISAPTECSFAGGCMIQVNQPGLLTIIN